MESIEDAQNLANQRANEAFLRKSSGENNISHKENKVPYNGADGLPIREEIISTHSKNVITRNAYGAHCLNTPDTLFIDVDFNNSPKIFLLAAIAFLIALTSLYLVSVYNLTPAIFFVVLLSRSIAKSISSLFISLQKINERDVIKKITGLVSDHKSLNFRVYKTPAGLRIIETSKKYDPTSTTVISLFTKLMADEKYALMCIKQKCFRARVSAKPWRIGIKHHMKPRPGVWPVSENNLPIRNAWIRNYEDEAKKYAACSFFKSFGSGLISLDVQHTIQLHDEQSQALTEKKIA